MSNTGMILWIDCWIYLTSLLLLIGVSTFWLSYLKPSFCCCSLLTFFCELILAKISTVQLSFLLLCIALLSCHCILRCHLWSPACNLESWLCIHDPAHMHPMQAGSGHQGIGQIHFLIRLCKRQLKQALSVLCLLVLCWVGFVLFCFFC